MWTANLFHVRSGAVGPSLAFEKFTWSMSINENEQFSITLNKTDLPRVDLKYWLEPWWAGVVLLYNGSPIVAGPIINRPSEELTGDALVVACGGIRSVLARRTVTAELTSWAKLPSSSITYSGMSLGTIAQRAVKQAQAKPGGELPIRYPMPEQLLASFATLKATLPACETESGNANGSNCFWDASTRGNKIGTSFAMINGKPVYSTVDAGHTRTYRGFNLQNIFADDVLTKLSNVIDGPDIMFNPRLEQPNKLVFDMVHGVEDHPRIPQATTPIWDTTAEKTPISNGKLIYSGSNQTNRVYSLGAGQDTKKIIEVVNNYYSVQDGYPLLETAITTSGNSENRVVVRNHGLSALVADSTPLQEIQFDLQINDSVPLTSIYPGMSVKIIVKGLLALRDGANDAIILSISGDDTDKVKLSLQPTSQYLIEDKSQADAV